MKLKEIAVVTGTVAALSLAAPAWVVAAGAGGYSDSGAAADTGAATGGSMPGGTSAAASDLMNMQVSELEGKAVVSPDGAELGQITSVVKDPQDQSLHAVVSVGGFLGLGEQQVAVPVDELQLQQERIVASNIESRDALMERTAYNEADFDNVDSNLSLAQASQPGAADTTADIASFDELDADSSGYISREEAQTSDPLINNWQSADKDANDQIDQSEFSAFEDQQKSQGAAQSSFNQLDGDGDGNISQSELMQYEVLARHWNAIDVNSDGQIDQAEFSAFEAGTQVDPSQLPSAGMGGAGTGMDGGNTGDSAPMDGATE